MSKKLLYFNLAIDESDTSLGFAINWIETIAENYDQVDVVSLRKVSNHNFSKSINIYGADKNNNKFNKYIYLYKKVKELCEENKYERCFSHMSPISIVVCGYLLKKNKIRTTLWFTHPGPKLGIKKLILFISFLISEYVVTASSTSFPIKSKKVNVIGHAIDLFKFQSERNHHKLDNFLILSRISRSKNLEIALDAFLNSDFKDCSLDIIGGTLNVDDERYLKLLKNKYSSNNIKFLGKVDHSKLPDVLKKYDVHFNSAKNGFYDKSVLETLSCGIINFYMNDDFNVLFGNDEYNFKNTTQLSQKLNNLKNLSDNEFVELQIKVKNKLNHHSLSTLFNRLKPYL